MKLSEKYKLLKNILRNKPNDLRVSYKLEKDIVTKLPYMEEFIEYYSGDYKIRVFCDNYITAAKKSYKIRTALFMILYWYDFPKQYRAYIYKEPNKKIKFNPIINDFYSLWARRLLKHGKRYNK